VLRYKLGFVSGMVVTIIDDSAKLQGKSYAKQVFVCFTIVCIAKRAWAATMKIEH
jgi:hypothetical protein